MQPHPLLTDINYGEWQGLLPEEVNTKWPAILAEWYRSPGTANIPSGESLGAVTARGLSLLNELANRHEGQTIVLVSHIVFNRAILLAVLGLEPTRFWTIPQETCAINILATIGNDCILKVMNDTRHLHAHDNT